MGVTERLESLLAAGRDDALLRFSLGSAYFKEKRFAEAADQLRAAVAHDPEYSAAWKFYGRALAEAGRAGEALDAFDRGIAVAEQKGDIQAAKEMRVFRKRAAKAQKSG
ncbi:MAG: tetratricopeptide repeat protein [Pseudomonadota bacterium]